MHGLFDIDLREVSWHFGTHEAIRPIMFKLQLTESTATQSSPNPHIDSGRFLAQVRAIGHCVIGRERGLIQPDWLNWWA